MIRLIYFLFLSIFAVSQIAAAESASWELRVCADPDNLPYSNQALEGFDNRIAAILADELGAHVTYEWTVINPNAVRLALDTGDCDVVLGVEEGASGVINTVPYYRAPFMFMQLDDGRPVITSLQDQNLKNLRIAAPANGIIHLALMELDLFSSFVAIQPNRSVRGPQRSLPMLEALRNGQADVAVVFGPEASALAAGTSGELILTPVQPELLPNLLPMYRITTLGVRSGDESLRDLLNIALARRWDDVQWVLSDMGIPQSPTPRPTHLDTGHADEMRIALVVPLPTSQQRATDVLAEAARTGAILAESLSARDPSIESRRVRLLFSASPSTDAAARATARLLATADVTAIIGGIGEAQAEAIVSVLADDDVIFLNIGDVSDGLRSQCLPNVLHIEASATMYLQALLSVHHAPGSVLVVHDESASGSALLNASLTLLEGYAQVETAVLPDNFAGLGSIIQSIAENRPGLVLVLAPPGSQELLISQLESTVPDQAIVAFPHPLTQTRDWLTQLRQSSAAFAGSPRPALWDTRLEGPLASDLNERFASMSGDPIEPSGWAAWAAIRLLTLADTTASAADPSSLLAELLNPESRFDLGKPAPVSFRHDGQLRQQLLWVVAEPDADWGKLVSGRIAMAAVSGLVPEYSDGMNPALLLDSFFPAPSACE